MKWSFPCCFINIYYETLQKIIQIFDKFEEQSQKNKFVSFFSTYGAGRWKKMKNLWFFVQISIMDCSFFLYIVHINMYISVVKACHNFFYPEESSTCIMVVFWYFVICAEKIYVLR